jgi:thiamine pyrophosphate-dependent acetolactate synthase large subunit-like protein
MQRIDAIRRIAELTAPDDLFVTSIGATLDDWWNCGHAAGTFFTTVLGSVSSTALGLAVALPHRRVVAIESDGSVLMNTGAMCTLGAEQPANLTVVVMDNGIYENIGGFPTHTSRRADLARMAAAAGCDVAASAGDADSFAQRLAGMLADGRLGYLVARISPGVHPWPSAQKKRTDGVEDKYRFLRHVEALEGIAIHPPQPRP